MITYRCPYCGERLNVAESELDRQTECAGCGTASRCPAKDYHKSRLRRLKSELARRPLSSLELREAAVHYRGLGQDDKARRAEKAARRAAEREEAGDLPPALAAATADLADDELGPAPGDTLALGIGAALWAGAATGLAVAYPAALAGWFAHGLAALAVAAGCALRGAALGWTLIAGLLLGAPFGLAYGLLYRAAPPRHLPRADTGVALGVAVAATSVWVGAMVRMAVVSLA